MPNLPAPLVPPRTDCSSLSSFMLDVDRLLASELVAVSSHEVIGAALLLWAMAWKQVPTSSLPNDDKVLAAFARLPANRFKALKAEVLRGFVLCSDGRLYHRTLAAEAIRAFEKRKVYLQKREADAERLRKWRAAHRENSPETPDEARFNPRRKTRFVAEETGRDGTVVSKEPSQEEGLRPNRIGQSPSPARARERRRPLVIDGGRA
jgi:uncharacterized protein YdaU (DUF1376 family)